MARVEYDGSIGALHVLRPAAQEARAQAGKKPLHCTHGALPPKALYLGRQAGRDPGDCCLPGDAPFFPGNDLRKKAGLFQFDTELHT